MAGTAWSVWRKPESHRSEAPMAGTEEPLWLTLAKKKRNFNGFI